MRAWFEPVARRRGEDDAHLLARVSLDGEVVMSGRALHQRAIGSVPFHAYAPGFRRFEGWEYALCFNMAVYSTGVVSLPAKVASRVGRPCADCLSIVLTGEPVNRQWIVRARKAAA